MDSQTLEKIERLKKAISASTDPDIIASLQKKLTSLESDVAKAEAAIEKKEEKIIAEEKKQNDENAEKLERLKKALAASTDPDIKASFQKKIDKLKSEAAADKKEIAEEKKEIAEQKKEVKEAAKEVEKIVKKVEVAEKKQEQKSVSDADDKIKRLEKAIAAQTDEDVKKTLKKRLAELKGTVSDVKKEIKQEAKKPVVRQVKVAKPVRKTPIKKAAPAPTPKKKEERKKKLKGVLAELDALIEKNRRLKAKYGSAYKGTGKPSDLERDSKRKAKPFGYRFIGKHDYRVPTEMQIKRGLKRGTIDYEARPNRADVSVKRKVKLEDGGMADMRFIEGEYYVKMKPAINEERAILLFMGNDNRAGHIKFKMFKEDGSISFLVVPERLNQYKNISKEFATKYINQFAKNKKIKQLEESIYKIDDAEIKELMEKKLQELKMMEDGGMMARGGKADKLYDTNLSREWKMLLKQDDFNVKKSMDANADPQRPYILDINDMAYFYESKKERDSDYDTIKILSKKMEDGGMAGNNPEWLVMIMSEDGNTHEWQGFAKSEDEALHKAEQDAGFESVESGINMLTDENGEAVEYKKGGKTKEKWIQDALAGKKGVLRATAKKKGLLRGEDDKLSKTDLKKLQKMGGKTAKRAHLAETLSKFKKGGKVGYSDEDKARFAKPAGWRWKEEAFKKGIVSRRQLSLNPSKYMRDKYPNLVYYEDRLNKSDKKPTRTSADSV